MMRETAQFWSMVDVLNEAFFYSQPVKAEQRVSIGKSLSAWLTPLVEAMETHASWVDALDSAVLYSGERLKTGFAARYILLLEGGLTLFRFGLGSAAEIRLLQRVGRVAQKTCFAQQCLKGECAVATIAWMRWLGAGLSPAAQPGVEHFLGLLMENRDGKGRWMRFPFFYTLLALEELTHLAARRERQYALQACLRFLNKRGEESERQRRRCDLAGRIVQEMEASLDMEQAI